MTTTTIERASSTDRAFLAMDTGAVPEQFGVLLRLDGDLDLPEVRRLLADRVAGLPRLRQVLEETPLGCGGPASFLIRKPTLREPRMNEPVSVSMYQGAGRMPSKSSRKRAR